MTKYKRIVFGNFFPNDLFNAVNGQLPDLNKPSIKIHLKNCNLKLSVDSAISTSLVNLKEEGLTKCL